MKTLYISDLDQTLLHSNQQLSDYTIKTIQELIEQDIYFSFATARSLITTKQVTKGLNISIPVIVYNGTFVMDYLTGDILLSHYFKEDIKDVIIDLINNHICPMVYSFTDGQERLSFLSQYQSKGIKDYLSKRKEDIRLNPVNTMNELLSGDIFYITCIDDVHLKDFYNKYKKQYHCLCQQDVYKDDYWFEIMPKDVSKAKAAKQLKQYLDCDKIVAFGDHYNDIELFLLADESYAVENAIIELKEIATGIIKSNDEDGVAIYLKNHVYK